MIRPVSRVMSIAEPEKTMQAPNDYCSELYHRQVSRYGGSRVESGRVT